MTDQFRCPTTLERLHAGPLGPHMGSLTTLLSEMGYASSTIQDKLRLIAELSHWLAEHSLRVEEVSEARIGEFLAESSRSRELLTGKLGLFGVLLASLREAGVVPPQAPKAPESPRGLLLHEFAQYLERERGLAGSTIGSYCRNADFFLDARFGTDPPRLSELSAADVTGFVLGSAEISWAKRRGYALRSFLRFLRQQGKISTDLAGAVPTVSVRCLSARLPESLESEQVEHVLSCCERSTAAGLRNYAILLLLARLGLRAGELVAMKLSDLDWRSGVLTVRGKGSRLDRLPIPQDVGEALASYLRDGRPPSSSARVFLRLRAPYRGFVCSTAIASVVRQALLRAGLSPAQQGAHLLRHTLATEMLRQGAGLAEIGQILRHRSPRSTEIYARVDLCALRELAQPWPGGGA